MQVMAWLLLRFSNTETSPQSVQYPRGMSLPLMNNRHSEIRKALETSYDCFILKTSFNDGIVVSATPSWLLGLACWWFGLLRE